MSQDREALSSQKGSSVTPDTLNSESESSVGEILAGALSPEVLDALVKDAQSNGGSLGVQELLNQMTKAVLERALDTELPHHLGYEKGDPARAGTGNSRNGRSTKEGVHCAQSSRVGRSTGPKWGVRAGDRAETIPPAGQYRRGDPVVALADMRAIYTAPTRKPPRSPSKISTSNVAFVVDDQDTQGPPPRHYPASNRGLGGAAGPQSCR